MAQTLGCETKTTKQETIANLARQTTYLTSTVSGAFFYLYLIMDVYSRKIVGWEFYPQEYAEHAASVFHKAHLCARAYVTMRWSCTRTMARP